MTHYEAWFIKNSYGEYLLGAHEYQSFDTIMSAEHCQLQDFFKFIFVEWNNEFFVPSEKELKAVKEYKEELLKNKQEHLEG